MEFISILGDTGLIACRECKFDILPSSIETHFQGNPHRVSKDDRNRILSEVEKLHNSLIWDRDELRDIEVSKSFPYFFPDLALYSDGFACQNCSYITRNIRVISRHYTDSHGWENPRGKGRISKNSSKDVPWKSGIYCQRFFHSTPGHFYFTVDPRRPFIEARSVRASSIEEQEEEIENRSNRSRSISIQGQGISLIFFIIEYLSNILYRSFELGSRVEFS